MTDDERQRLFDALRNTHPSRIMCKEAADEIERLAALAQSDAEPVARDDQWLSLGLSLEPVTFWYRNYKGKVSRRVAMIEGMRWGTSEYHKEPQWLLRGFDLQKEAEREFAVKDMAPTREALAQSDAEKELNDIAVAIGSNRFLDPPDGGSVSLAEQVTRMRQALEKAEAAQSDAEPQETWNKQPPGPDSILHELGDCPTQSDAEPAQPQTLRDAAENLLIAIDMGWDLNGCAENLRAVLAQSDAEPVAWQYRWKMDLFDGGKAWSPWHDLPEGCVNRYAGLPDYETRALYTAPPRPDTSAGLIEAAEHCRSRAEYFDRTKGHFDREDAARSYRATADHLEKMARARAADRSGK